jgi:raffinose/stachyose/melibiose transport system permease protein
MTAIAQRDPRRSTDFMFAPLLSGSGKLLLHLALLAIGLAYIFPFIWMAGSALKTNSEFFSAGINPFPAAPQWNNFLIAWNEASFSRYMFNTVFTTVVTTLLVIWFTSMAGYALGKLHMPGKKYLLVAIGVLFFLPAGYTIIPVIEIVRTLGLMNTYWAVIITATAGGMLFNTFLFTGYMRTIPNELEEAAVIDGATLWQRYLFIILPLARPMVATVGLFTFMSNWNSFFGPLVFTLGAPELRTLAVGMFAFVGATSRDWPLLCMGATISIVPIVAVYIFLQRYFIEAFAGAVKS